MFCSKCGKTIPTGAETCPSCGKAVGNARFVCSELTSAQSIIIPGQDEYESVPVNNYTRTTYTSMSDTQKESGEVDSRTSYRPLYEGSAPANVRSGMRTAAEESRERVARRGETARVSGPVRTNNEAADGERDVRKEIEEVLSDDYEEAPEVTEPKREEEAPKTVPKEEEQEPVQETAEEEKPVEPISLENLSEATREKIGELDAALRPEEEELDMSQFKARPIEARGRAGISRDVSEYIRQIEDGQSRKARRKAAETEDEMPEDDLSDIEDAEAPDVPEPARRPQRTRKAPATPAPEDDKAENVEDIPDVEAKPRKAENKPVKKASESDDEAFEDLDYDEEYGDEERPAVIGTIIKIMIAVVVVAVVAFGVIRYVSYIRSNQSSAPIEGVTESVYNSAIELIDSHSTDEYKNQLLSDYNTNGVLAVSTQLESDSAAINALLPAEPSTNDATFLEAVTKIQDNIGSAILMDALSDGSADAATESESRWSVVNNSIAQLKSAKSAAELTAIINGETITVHNETPEPTATEVVYTSLQKGDENNDVLQLQVRLYTLGYLTGDRDGAFGSETQTAIKLFQQTAGLEQTGIADSATQALLYSDDAPYAPGVTTPTPAPAVTDTPAPTEAPVEEASDSAAGDTAEVADDGTQAA